MADAAATGTLELGMMLDRYELLYAIARGGMANVWLSRIRGKHNFERLVAVKTILPEFALDPQFQKMFLEEARIVSGIDHPNVTKTFDLGEHHQELYLVMEYVDGDSLSRIRKHLNRINSRMPLALSLRILSDVCAGLHAAHELRTPDGEALHVVHRDVSPQNVLIASNGSVKLIDFGVAKARDRLVEETGAGFTKGKPRYMAPEQATGQPIDRRADVYAVGAIAYEILEGRGPYDADNDMARVHALVTGLEITSMPSKPPPPVEAMVLKALARDPSKRFQTCAELRAAIEDAMIKTRLRATSDDLAQFVNSKTAERSEERQKIVKMALSAATARERFKNILEDASSAVGRARDDSSSDIHSISGLNPESAPELPKELDEVADLVPSPPRKSRPSMGAVRFVATDAPVAKGGSMASAAEVDQPAEMPRKKLGLYAIGAAAALALVIGIGVVARHKTSEPAVMTPASLLVQPQTRIPPPPPEASVAMFAPSAPPTSAGVGSPVASSPPVVVKPAITAAPIPSHKTTTKPPPVGSAKKPPKHNDDQIQ